MTKDEEKRDKYFQKKYGITLAQYNKMLNAQGGACVICKLPPKKTRLAVEHDHKTKRVRGLACWRCNKMLIGRWRAEHAPLLRRTADYLESTFDGRTV